MCRRETTLLVMMVAVVGTTGCAESATMVGNGLSAVVACALLWSTVNLDRDTADEDG